MVKHQADDLYPDARILFLPRLSGATGKAKDCRKSRLPAPPKEWIMSCHRRPIRACLGVIAAPSLNGLSRPFAAAPRAARSFAAAPRDGWAATVKAQGAVLAQNDDADGLNSRLDFASALAGDCCVEIGALDPQPGNLTISVQKPDVAAFLQRLSQGRSESACGPQRSDPSRRSGADEADGHAA